MKGNALEEVLQSSLVRRLLPGSSTLGPSNALRMIGVALQVGRVCVKLPRATNNVAEYTALIYGLEVRMKLADCTLGWPCAQNSTQHACRH